MRHDPPRLGLAPPETARRPERDRSVSLLDADPDLGALLDGSRRVGARRALRVRAHHLPLGPWNVTRLMRAGAESIGLLVLDGVIAHELSIAGHTSVELLGTGDLLRPWQSARRPSLLPVAESWAIHEPACIAVLDRAFAIELAHWPEINAMLHDRLGQHAQRLATQQAISQLTRVDRRLRALFWHLADRWGHVCSDGVLVRLTLSHRMLGALVGAQRPTISTALSALAERGELVRRPDGAWLLRGRPPELVAATSPPLVASPARETPLRPNVPRARSVADA